MRVNSSRLRFAHSSPIYAAVDSRLAHEPASVREGELLLRYFLPWAEARGLDSWWMAEVRAAVAAAQHLYASRSDPAFDP